MKQPPSIEKARQALGQFLEALGYDLTQPHLAETPIRVVDAYLNDLVVGERTDAARIIEQGSVAGAADSLVIVRDIATMTMCPHHLLPAQGHATVAYLPGSRILGLGTLAQLIDACCRRLILQEQIGEDVTTMLMTKAGARGAFCALRLEHACLRLRGARQDCSVVETTSIVGQLRDEPFASQLAIALGKKALAQEDRA